MKSLPNKEKTIKCPQCLNYMKVSECNNGAYKGMCSVCKSIIYSREHSKKETLLKIIRQ